MKSLIAAALLLAVSVTAGCSAKSHPESTDASAPPAKVRVASVQRDSTAVSHRIMGTVVARNRADVESKVQARVERVAVTLGSRVRAGDLIAELDTREFEARVLQARAANEQATRDLARYEALHSQEAATAQEYDGARTRAATTAAALDEAEAMLSYARIKAPFSGVVTAKFVDVGDLATPGRALFVLQEEAALRFVVTVPESYVDMVHLRDSVEVEFARTGEFVKGVVEEISPGADPASRSYEAKIALPRAGNLRPGQFGTLLLASGDDSKLWIPSAALVRRGQLELVYVASTEGVADLRLVRTAAQQTDKIEILAGLSDGEQVILSGHAGLEDGDRIEIVP